MKLSDEQKKAVGHGKGPMMVLAGPGAGKTTVITHRVKNLIERDGVNPAQILVVTFSKAASVEMRERFEMITGSRQLPVRFGTFHSLFFQILKTAYHYSAKDIVTPKLKYRFMEEALFETEYDDIEDRKEFLDEIEKEISRVKGDGTDIEHYYSASCPEEIFRQIYRGYQSRVQKNHCLDFDDMVMYTYELFRARPDILARWRNGLRISSSMNFRISTASSTRISKCLPARMTICSSSGMTISRSMGSGGRGRISCLHFPENIKICRR